MKKIPVGIIGATGMVGQRFVTLLKNHPFFDIVALAASPRSVNQKYQQAVKGRWVMSEPIPKSIKNIRVMGVEKDLEEIAKRVELVFSALDMEKEKIRSVEDGFANLGVVVVSNNSAHRWTKDVPMIMPEINPQHLKLIKHQQENHGWKRGFVVVKPNCSIQSYVPMLTPLLKYGIKKVVVTTLQAVSGAGKILKDWPQMQENLIPNIPGEEEKSEIEPSKIWGKLIDGQIKLTGPAISATCIRVPLEDGHMAAVAVSFKKKVSKKQIINEWKKFNPLKFLKLPSAPNPFITYFEEDDRPQTKLDRNLEDGMGIAAGRLREDGEGFKFIGLSHNTIRGAAGGAILTAELLMKKGYIDG
ncbi:aspartate-semialdehyde dehydrogenase [Candidatus Daviesbacteria bacterium]|nr:aspartate-semialdehyde dehydrogenase [Candidatus Daviesbacteria bacterium]